MATYNGWLICNPPTIPVTASGTPIAPKSVEWSGSDIVGVSTNPFQETQQIYNWNQAWLEASFAYPPMRYAPAQAWIAWLMSLQGTANVFQLGDPLQAPINPLAVGGLTAASGGQTGNVIVTAGGGHQSVGDWIQIGWHLHKITAISGPSFTIWPPIRESPTAGQGIATTGCVGIWRLKDNNRKWKCQPNKLFDLSFEVREAL